MSYIGTNKVGKMYLGGTAIGKAYLGSDLVFDSAGGGQVLPYDAEIEYLQSSGTQYIDTGINAQSVSRFIVSGYCNVNGGNNTQLLGGNEQGASTFFGARVTAVTHWYCNDSSGGLGDPTRNSTIDATINSTSSQTGTLTDLTNNTTYNFTSFGSASWSFPNSNLLLFGGYSTRRSPNARCYSLQIYTSSGLVRDFIPVRIGTTGYMYDRVSRQLLGNAGSGDFALGGDVIGNGAYIKCSYVVPSSSSAIFTTGVTALGSEWELDLQDSVTTSGNQVFICSKDNGGCFAAVNSSGKFALGASNVMTTASTRTTVGIEFIDKGMIMTIGGNNTQRVGTTSHNQYVSLLGYNGNYLYQGKIYGIKCVSGGSFDAVPARRISDGVYGLYDTANGVFYTNFTGA